MQPEPSSRYASAHPCTYFHAGTNTHAKPRLSDVAAALAVAQASDKVIKACLGEPDDDSRRPPRSLHR
jgi:hypothetical protein